MTIRRGVRGSSFNEFSRRPPASHSILRWGFLVRMAHSVHWRRLARWQTGWFRMVSNGIRFDFSLHCRIIAGVSAVTAHLVQYDNANATKLNTAF
jgi:hypothetical protein